MIEGGIRTPVDLALYSHYLAKVPAGMGAAANDNHQRGSEMTLSEAISCGLEPPL